MSFDDVIPAARALLGATLSTDRDGGRVSLRITEVEAYAGEEDPASHAYRGPNSRNAAMFGPPWRAYVYRHMGLHTCFNIVVGKEGTPTGILIRAGEIIEGTALAHQRRSEKGRVRSPKELASGPARLTVALGINTADNNAPLDGSTGIQLRYGPHTPERKIATGPRVGVGSARETLARFWISGNPTVSTYKPAPPPRARRTT
ncbi:DNA-3-methyladenine glycosylase [Dermatophilus congolensis]|uniref:Putative 3-methyladenine DNA glycosylase n=1 Tax=Dermatophilus congolensis TaxID=1863 RepID=A0A239VAN9_9MICO|nr:DNA-3-methyladenine glycosylase [Dermatophilus congolensis]MBO3130671.1 DNA-3-methyladenine glycosylase [Dermatophilus congolensis]MBO3130699.1 DNA-3-methyladenine glycosylase [Dermatophilus congolensis]MBO3135144.1 DNA-3-methyladenine glycosylase [Dermatophilus congolensis]MBO3137383.1 DNA-3-methyladenine glycosylase [Dermatophilus congolensis]MBO3139624.1 DNA-3-methyladenine glycosylase [Dermatophilus congolensis]